MSLRDLQPAGVPANWRRTIWPAFEIKVIELLCAGCVRLRRDKRRRTEWEERHYSWAVVRHLENLCCEQNLSFSPRYDLQELSDEEFAAGKSPKSAPLVDVCLRWHQHIPEIRFAVEAKILVVRTVRSYRPGKSVDDYVEKGVRRFLDEKYARSMPAGAMIGYVLNGTAVQLVPKINEQMESQQVSQNGPLGRVHTLAPEIPCYQSNHIANGNTLRLHHVFVEFAAISDSTGESV